MTVSICWYKDIPGKTMMLKNKKQILLQI